MNTVNEYPTDHYEDLSDYISFAGFDFSKYWAHEKSVLQPQLEALGYTNIEWLPGETDDFGPLTRVCRARNPKFDEIYFIYG